VKSIVRLVLLAVCASIIGCGSTPVAQDLNQSQANEIVALLTTRGIPAVAHKESGGKGLFAVQISPDHYGAAVTLLHERGLPGEVRPTAQELLAPQGIIPSSREMEALRLDHALAAQIEEMLQNHPSISKARGVVRLNFLKEEQHPSASLVVELRSAAPAVSEAEVAAVVMSALPGIAREAVSIQLATALRDEGGNDSSGGVQLEPMVGFLWFWKVPQSEYLGLALLFSGAMILVGCVAAGLGYWICLFYRTRDSVESSIPEVFPKSLRFDRAGKDLPE
jgi:type III secretory pathway lipoprotein EscJ